MALGVFVAGIVLLSFLQVMSMTCRTQIELARESLGSPELEVRSVEGGPWPLHRVHYELLSKGSPIDPAEKTGTLEDARDRSSEGPVTYEDADPPGLVNVGDRIVLTDHTDSAVLLRDGGGRFLGGNVACQ